jgi:hypothetical protein
MRIRWSTQKSTYSTLGQEAQRDNEARQKEKSKLSGRRREEKEAGERGRGAINESIVGQPASLRRS